MRLSHCLITALAIATAASAAYSEPAKNREGKSFTVVEANVPVGRAPEWARLERRLISEMNSAAEDAMNSYVRVPGDLRHAPCKLDDAYECFGNWPLFYALGGDEKVLRYSDEQWDEITRLWSGWNWGPVPAVVKEFYSCWDWMHLGEGYNFFYYLGLADPYNPKYIKRAKRFAGFYLNEDPDAPNYDPARKLIKAPHTGSLGPGDYQFAGDSTYTADQYGLPFYDIPGVKDYSDFAKSRDARQRMAEAKRARNAKGDVPVNLAATSLVTNAYLYTGEAKYKDWVIEYVGAWRERIKENGGIVPDNVGLSGKIGEYIDGKWYGGNYGWTWPHGWETIADALTIGAQNAGVLSGDFSYMEMVRSQMDMLIGLGIERDGTLFVPFKHADPGLARIKPIAGQNALMGADGWAIEKDGWFEFKAMQPQIPSILWYMQLQDDDFARSVRLREKSYRGWEQIATSDFINHKHQAGHDVSWLSYLTGGYSKFSEDILAHSIKLVRERDAKIRARKPRRNYTGPYQNPLVTEALVNLTLGGPCAVYNGGLQFAAVRHFDWGKKRPGLPEDVSALVTSIKPDRVTLELVNLSRTEPRELVVQAGAYAEHRFTTLIYRTQIDGIFRAKKVPVNDKWLFVHLEPESTIKLDLGMERFVNTPTYALPW